MNVKVLGKSIKVIDGGLNQDTFGEFKAEPSLTINLQPHLKGKQRKRVLLHEMIHAMFELTGLHLELDSDLEERITVALEYHIEDIVKEANAKG